MNRAQDQSARGDWIRLAHAGLSPLRLLKMVERTGGSPQPVLAAIQRNKVKVAQWASKAVEVPANVRQENLRSKGIEFLLPGDSGFPPQLVNMPEAPLFIFRRGHAPPNSDTVVAVVGTRSCSSYGKRIAEQYGEAISRAGWRVVSGLARGVDSAAHWGSLHGPAPGMAVLGSGVDIWYPKENKKLGEELLEKGGTIWSEYPPGAPPKGWRFPCRNRIISGLSKVVIIVEAAVAGGALITARTALAQGREVCAPPGDITRPSSIGCNQLIRDGAHPVHDAQDMVETLRLLLDEPAPSGKGKSVLPPAEESLALDQFLAGLGLNPIAALAELGRLQAVGEVVVEGGMVLRRGKSV